MVLYTKPIKEKVEDILVTAFEGGSNYWLDIAPSEERKVREWYKANMPSGAEDTASFAEKAARYIYRNEEGIEIVDSEDAEEVLGNLTYSGMKKAFRNGFRDSNLSEHLQDLREDNWDANTADVIIQFAILGEIVYG